jgi:integrase
MLGMLYGCGLRSYELCNLKLSEVDFERKRIKQYYKNRVFENLENVKLWLHTFVRERIFLIKSLKVLLIITFF